MNGPEGAPIVHDDEQQPVAMAAQDEMVVSNDNALIMYSLFMALSSIVFGALSLWQANGTIDVLSDGKERTFMELFVIRILQIFDNFKKTVDRVVLLLGSINPLTFVWLSSMMCLLVLLAFATNPTDASFKSYLTESTLQQHFQHFRDNALRTESSLDEHVTESHLVPAQTFANRIRITLQTPAYLRLDYGIFSVIHSPNRDYRGTLVTLSFVGAFGKWWSFSAALGSKEAQKDWNIKSFQNLDRADSQQSETSPVQSQPKHSEEVQKTTPAGKKRKGNRKGSSTPSVVSEHVEVKSSPADESHASVNDEPELEQQHDSAQLEAIGEAQVQLENIRTTSESARKALQEQLDELRARKRDEDLTRSDLKSKMKHLDEQKRQSEGVKREAERRLKAATSVNESMQRRIEESKKEMSQLQEKEERISKKAVQSNQNKGETLQKLHQEITEKETKGDAAEARLDALRAKVDAMNQLLREQELRLESARSYASEQYAAYGFAEGMPYSQDATQFEDNSHSFSAVPDDHFANDEYYTEIAPQSSSWQDYVNAAPIAPLARAPTNAAVMSNTISNDDDEDDELNNDAFDPTLLVSNFRGGSHTSPSLQNRPTRFSPFSFDRVRSFLTQTDHDAIVQNRASATATPLSPFQSDLLPSNLFQNADEDERHDGILPGSRSERIEAALDRFGFAHSDTSDAEDAQTSSPRPARLDRKTSFGGRSWWGGRTRSKERLPHQQASSGEQDRSVSSIQSTAAAAPAADDGSVVKRRSLSIFPKLSLNPTAKSFRGSMMMKRNGSAQTTDDPNGSFSSGDSAMHQAWMQSDKSRTSSTDPWNQSHSEQL